MLINCLNNGRSSIRKVVILWTGLGSLEEGSFFWNNGSSKPMNKDLLMRSLIWPSFSILGFSSMLVNRQPQEIKLLLINWTWWPLSKEKKHRKVQSKSKGFSFKGVQCINTYWVRHHNLQKSSRISRCFT